MAAANSAAQVSTVLYTGRRPSRWRSDLTPSSPANSGRKAAICRSDSPARLACRSRAQIQHWRVHDLLAQLDQSGDLVDEPRVDSRRPRRRPRRSRPAAGRARRCTAARRAEPAAPCRVASTVAPAGSGVGPEPGCLGLHRPHGLVQGLGEVTARATSPRRPTSSSSSAPGRRRGTSRRRTEGSSPPRSPELARTPPGSLG